MNGEVQKAGEERRGAKGKGAVGRLRGGRGCEGSLSEVEGKVG